MNNKRLTIPKNKNGEKDIEYGKYETNDVISIVFLDDEVNHMFHDGVFDKINQMCNIGIDDYESEEIPHDKIKVAMSIVDESKYPLFYQGLKYAEEYGEFLSIDL